MVYGIITVTIIIIHTCIGGGGVTIPRTVVVFFQPLLDCMRVGRHSNSTQLRVFMCVLGVGAVHVPWVHGGEWELIHIHTQHIHVHQIRVRVKYTLVITALNQTSVY